MPIIRYAVVLFTLCFMASVSGWSAEAHSQGTGETQVGLEPAGGTVCWPNTQSILDLNDKAEYSKYKVIYIASRMGGKGYQTVVTFSVGASSVDVITVNVDGKTRYEGELNIQQLTARQKADNVREFASIDSVAADADTSSPNDSNQFDKTMLANGWVSRGQARGQGSSVPANYPLPGDRSVIPYVTPLKTVPPSKGPIMAAAGVLEIEAAFPDGRGGEKKAYFYAMAQADVIYYSGHGYPNGDVKLSDGMFNLVTGVGKLWQEDLEVVILAGCSLLGWPDSGRQIVQLGPKIALGYGNYKDKNVFGKARAPGDIQGGGADKTFTARIIQAYLVSDPDLTKPHFWLLANDKTTTIINTNPDGSTTVLRGKNSMNRNAYHSVALDYRDGSNIKYWYWDVTDPNNPTISVDLEKTTP